MSAVYVLYNDYYFFKGPDGTHIPLSKVGATLRTPDHRREELAQPTGVPGPFRTAGVIEAANAFAIEREFKRLFRHLRTDDGRREFYRMTPAQALAHLRAIAKTIGDVGPSVEAPAGGAPGPSPRAAARRTSQPSRRDAAAPHPDTAIPSFNVTKSQVRFSLELPMVGALSVAVLATRPGAAAAAAWLEGRLRTLAAVLEDQVSQAVAEGACHKDTAEMRALLRVLLLGRACEATNPGEIEALLHPELKFLVDGRSWRARFRQPDCADPLIERFWRSSIWSVEPPDDVAIFWPDLCEGARGRSLLALVAEGAARMVGRDEGGMPVFELPRDRDCDVFLGCRYAVKGSYGMGGFSLRDDGGGIHYHLPPEAPGRSVALVARRDREVDRLVGRLLAERPLDAVRRFGMGTVARD